MKVCSKCKIEQTILGFSKNKTTKDGLHSWCKKCHAQYYYNHQKQRIQYSRDYKQANKEAVLTYYQTHKEEVAKYYQNHKKANSEKRKQYYQSHQEEILAYKKQYYQTHQGEMIQKKRQYRLTHKKIILDKHYQQRYGLKYGDVLEMLKKQGNKCLICDRVIVLKGHSTNSAYIDHDHKTGKVRGLLCMHCNRGLGGFDDSIQFLLKAIDYLQKNLPLDKSSKM